MRAPGNKLSLPGRTLARFMLCFQLPIVRVVGFQFTERFVFGSRVQRYDKLSYQGYVKKTLTFVKLTSIEGEALTKS